MTKARIDYVIEYLYANELYYAPCSRGVAYVEQTQMSVAKTDWPDGHSIIPKYIHIIKYNMQQMVPCYDYRAPNYITYWI